MKKVVYLLLLILSFNLSAQKRTEIFFFDFVECFYLKNSSESIIIFDKPNGNKINELPPLNNDFCYYKFALSESSAGYLKIENIIVLPGCEKNELNENIGKFKGKWILAKNMHIFLPQGGGNEMNFYEKPNTNSKVIFTANDYISTELIEISGTWAKLKFHWNENEIIGWLERKYQCAYPWTNCVVGE